MDPRLNIIHPFLTRDMLRFGKELKLELRIYTQANDIFTVSIRGITRSGIINFKHITIATSSVTSTIFRLDDFPIALGIKNTVGNAAQSQIWASAELLVNSDIAIPLCSGLISRLKGISYPLIHSSDQRPSGGFLTSQDTADPAAGAQLDYFIPSAQSWKIFFANMTLVTDATVANRRLHVNFVDSGGSICRCIASVDQAASVTRNYSIAPYPSLLTAGDNTDILIPMPTNIILRGDSEITTTVTNMAVGDNLSIMKIYHEKYYFDN